MLPTHETEKIHSVGTRYGQDEVARFIAEMGTPAMELQVFGMQIEKKIGLT